jgi:hypothetical protein
MHLSLRIDGAEARAEPVERYRSFSKKASPRAGKIDDRRFNGRVHFSALEHEIGVRQRRAIDSACHERPAALQDRMRQRVLRHANADRQPSGRMRFGKKRRTSNDHDDRRGQKAFGGKNRQRIIVSELKKLYRICNTKGHAKVGVGSGRLVDVRDGFGTLRIACKDVSGFVRIDNRAAGEDDACRLFDNVVDALTP